MEPHPPAPPPPLAQSETWWPAVAGAIFALALALRLLYFTGPSLADDFAYLEHAYDWAHSRFDPAQLDYVYGLRYGVILPTAAAMRLFGPAAWSVTLPALLASLGGVWIALWLGRRALGPLGGAVAGGFAAVNPLTALYATLVMPEAFLDLALWGAMALTWCGAERRSRVAWLLAGIAGGAAYLVRSYGVVLAALGALPILLGRPIGARRSPRLAWLFFALGLAAPPALEMLYHAVAAGDPLLTAHLQARVYADMGNLNASLLYYPKVLARPDWDWAFGAYPWLVASAAVIAWRRGAAPALALWWIALWFGFLEFSLMSVTPPVAIHKDLRFLSVLVLPMGLVLGAAARSLFVPSKPPARAGRWLRLAALAAAALALAVGLEKGWGTKRRLLARVHKYRAFAERIEAARPHEVVFPHARWPLRVNYFTGYDDGFRAYAPPRAPQRFRVASPGDRPHDGAWVVVDPGLYGPDGDWKYGYARLPEWLETPPAHWPERARADGARIVEVEGASPESSRR
jgi:hypothetical protein